jgi:hypothetical protein
MRMNNPVILLWKVLWLNETWALSRALRRKDEPSRQVFELCRKAMVATPGHIPWAVVQIILGRSTWAVRRRANRGDLGKHWQGLFPAQVVMARQRARLRAGTFAPVDDARWWQVVPIVMERRSVPTWFAWHNWDRLSLPDLAEWCRRLADPAPVQGKEILEQVDLPGAEIRDAWAAPPVAVRMMQSGTGYFATSWFDGSDITRLAWNRWVLENRRLPDPAGMRPSGLRRLRVAPRSGSARKENAGSGDEAC